MHAPKQKVVRFEETTSTAHKRSGTKAASGTQAREVIVIKDEDAEATVQTTVAQPDFPPGIRPYEALLRRAGIDDLRALKAILPLNKIDDWVSWLAGVRMHSSLKAVARGLRLSPLMLLVQKDEIKRECPEAFKDLACQFMFVTALEDSMR